MHCSCSLRRTDEQNVPNAVDPLRSSRKSQGTFTWCWGVVLCVHKVHATPSLEAGSPRVECAKCRFSGERGGLATFPGGRDAPLALRVGSRALLGAHLLGWTCVPDKKKKPPCQLHHWTQRCSDRGAKRKTRALGPETRLGWTCATKKDQVPHKGGSSRETSSDTSPEQGALLALLLPLGSPPPFYFGLCPKNKTSPPGPPGPETCLWTCVCVRTPSPSPPGCARAGGPQGAHVCGRSPGALPLPARF